MNKFTELFKLTEKVGIVIPSTIEINSDFDNTEIVNETITLLSNLFGGATAINQNGGWVSETEGLVLESSVMVYAYAEELTDGALNEIHTYSENLANYLKQDAIAVEINSKLYFIEQTA